MRVSFPTLPTDNPGGQTYVRFDGEFGTSFSDSRHLWKFLKQLDQDRKGTATTVVDNTSTSVPPGSQSTVYPLESTDGSRTAFTFPFTFFEDRLDLYLNGLFQRPSVDYLYNATSKQVNFVTAPGAGDQIWAIGFASE